MSRHVRGERAEVFLDGLVVADIRQHLLEEREFGLRAGTGRPDCAIRLSSPTVFSVTVLPPVLGPLISSVRRSCDSAPGRSARPLCWRRRSTSSSSGWRASFAAAGVSPKRGMTQSKSQREARLGEDQFQLRHGDQRLRMESP